MLAELNFYLFQESFKCCLLEQNSISQSNFTTTMQDSTEKRRSADEMFHSNDVEEKNHQNLFSFDQINATDIVRDSCESVLFPKVKYRPQIVVTLSLLPFFTFYKIIFTLLFVLMNFTRRSKKMSNSFSLAVTQYVANEK